MILRRESQRRIVGMRKVVAICGGALGETWAWRGCGDWVELRKVVATELKSLERKSSKGDPKKTTTKI